MSATTIARRTVRLDKLSRKALVYQAFMVTVLSAALVLLFWLTVDVFMWLGPLAALAPALAFAACIWFFLPAITAGALGVYLALRYRDGDYRAIDRAYMRAYKTFRPLFLARPQIGAVNLCNLATARLWQGYFDSSADHFADAIELARKDRRFANSAHMAVIYNNYAIAMMCRGKLDQAEELARRAVALIQERGADWYGEVKGLPFLTLGSVLVHQNRLEGAREQLSLSRIHLDKDPALHRMLASQCLYESLLYARSQQFSKSFERLDEVANHVAADACSLTTISVMPLYILANEYMNAKHYERAEQALQMAYSIGRDNPAHESSLKLLKYYEKLLLLTNRQDEILDMQCWLLDKPQDI